MKRLLSAIVTILFSLIFTWSAGFYNTNGIAVTIEQFYPPFATHTLSAKETQEFVKYYEKIELVPDTSGEIPDETGWYFTINNKGAITVLYLVYPDCVTGGERYVVENGEAFKEFCDLLVFKYYGI